MTIDRSEVNRALAKAIAYKQCGKDAEARTPAPHRRIGQGYHHHFTTMVRTIVVEVMVSMVGMVSPS